MTLRQQRSGERLWKAREFARQAGVTVRALHHYDRLGLLSPTGRSAAGYRLYGPADLRRLQQIVTLKFIGLPLKQIREFLRRPDFDIRRALAAQRAALEDQRLRLGRAIRAIAAAEAALTRGPAGPDAFRKIIEVIELANNKDWMGKYYGESARAKIRERAKSVSPQQIAAGERAWAALIAEVEAAAAAGIDPASEPARALAARWRGLLREFTGGDPEIQAGLNKLYADRENWPATFQRPYSEAAGAFIRKAMAC